MTSDDVKDLVEGAHTCSSNGASYYWGIFDQVKEGGMDGLEAIMLERHNAARIFFYRFTICVYVCLIHCSH